MRFVILHHTEVDQPHFDIMVEATDHLLMTWRSPTWPIVETTTLTRLPDHRHAYLEYEGPVSNNRGSVRRVEDGDCTIDFSGVFQMPSIQIRQRDGEWIAERK